MTCEERDQDLLLLTHGELAPLRRLITQRHLLKCSRCRERQARFAVVSAGIQGALRPDLPPRWSAVSVQSSPARRAITHAFSIAAWLRLTALITLSALLILLLAYLIRTLT